MVKRAPRAVAIELGHLDHLVHHALSRHGSVAVHQDGYHRILGVVFTVNPGTGDALHHRVHSLQMGGVGRQRDVDRLAGVGHEVRAVAHVVLHVAVKVLPVIVGLARELLENVGVRLVEDVGQGVQAAAVGHADDELLGAQLGAALHDGVQRREHAFSPLHAEALLAHEFLLEKLLEHRGLIELLEDLLLLLRAQHGTVGELNVLLEPGPTLRLADVHVLDANAVAVGLLQVGDDVAQGRRADADLTARFKHRVEVRFLQPEVGDAEVRAVITAFPDRIGLGEEMTAGAVSMNQVDYPEFLGTHCGPRRPGGTALKGVLAIDALGKVETEEKVPPRRVYRIRVGEKLPIQGLDGGRLGVAQV